MKKLKLELINICLCLSLLSCSNSDYQIKRDYSNKYNVKYKNVKIINDFGIYNSARAVYIYDQTQNFLDDYLFEKIGIYLFMYPRRLNLNIYHNNDFLTLNEAFENQVLSIDDISELYLKDFNYKDNLITSYIHAEYNSQFIKENGMYNDLEYFPLINYGKYNDSYVMLYTGEILEYKYTQIEIEKYNFDYFTNDFIVVWNNHKFYSLEEAYVNKLLEYNDLKKIYECHINSYFISVK